MARFKIDIPEELREKISKQVSEVHQRVLSGELPNYPTFAWNLMKSMETVKEELHHSATGLAGEAGEVLDISKKVWVYGKELDLYHLIEELGDMRFYYQTVLNMLGLDDQDIIAFNMEKLSQRYADGKYSNVHAIGRADKKTEVARSFIGMHQEEDQE